MAQAAETPNAAAEPETCLYCGTSWVKPRHQRKGFASRVPQVLAQLFRETRACLARSGFDATSSTG